MSLNKEHDALIKAAKYYMPKGAMIAGGALTSIYTAQPINDVDFYFKNRAAFEDGVHRAYDDGMWCVDISKRAITFARGESICQLMHFDWFATAHDVFDAFDFTCCMAAYDCDEKSFVFHDDFLKHASQRHLSFHSGTRFPFGSLLRVLKYQKRGYTIGKSDLIRIALKCHSVPITSWDDLRDCIGGQYGEKIAMACEGDFSIDSAIAAFEVTDFSITAPEGKELASSADELLAKIFDDYTPDAGNSLSELGI